MNRAFWDSLTAKAGESQREFKQLSYEPKGIGYRLEVRGGVLWIAHRGGQMITAASAADLRERVPGLNGGAR